MGILLTDAEIEEIIGVELNLLYSGHVKEYHDIARAQLKKVAGNAEKYLTDVYEDGEWKGVIVYGFTEDVWQSLLEEVKE